MQRIGFIIFIFIALLIFAYVDIDVSEETTLIIMGSLSIIFPLGFLLQKWSIKKNGEYADATVIKTKRVRSRDGFTYIPVVKYDANGRIYETESNVGHIRPRYEDGETVRIIYSKKDAKKIVILKDGPTAAIIIGIFLLIGAIMFGVVLYRYLS